MTIPRNIIEKAVEGGYHPYPNHKDVYSLQVGDNQVAAKYIMDSHTPIQTFHWHEIALDPSFWQALGKALGWHDGKGTLPEGMTFGDWEEQYWKTRALRFFDLILTGGDTEKFWEELLPT